MALIARLQHPFIVEFKEAWVEKVCTMYYTQVDCNVSLHDFPVILCFFVYFCAISI